MDAILTVLIAVLGGAIRVSTPFLFVSLGECITEKSGRINLGLEGTMVFGAMCGYAVSYHTGSPWLGVLAAGLSGVAFGTVHGLLCSLPRVNDTAVGISLIVLGLGLAFFFGKAYVQPTAPRLPSIDLGSWADLPALRAALQVNALFVIGAVLALALHWAFANTRWGLQLRTVGDSADAARALGLPVARTRLPVAVLPGQLERGAVERAGRDGGRAGDLRALAAARLLQGGADLRRRELDRTGASGGGGAGGLPPVERRALRADAGDHARQHLEGPCVDRRAGRAVDDAMTRSER